MNYEKHIPDITIEGKRKKNKKPKVARSKRLKLNSDRRKWRGSSKEPKKK